MATKIRYLLACQSPMILITSFCFKKDVILCRGFDDRQESRACFPLLPLLFPLCLSSHFHPSCSNAQPPNETIKWKTKLVQSVLWDVVTFAGHNHGIQTMPGGPLPGCKTSRYQIGSKSGPKITLAWAHARAPIPQKRFVLGMHVHEPSLLPPGKASALQAATIHRDRGRGPRRLIGACIQG
jgi:hypothetical protein